MGGSRGVRNSSKPQGLYSMCGDIKVNRVVPVSKLR